ncbi:hypothetical protein AB0M22_19570 [Nocardia sp. NPDC051756]|uniref:hypothetical protein n=1 Tax=Nocardia sp. NPDC051756 TaxID=3154751 RepID=UPI0034307AA1
MHPRALVPPGTVTLGHLIPAVVMATAIADGQPHAESETADHHGRQYRARDPQRA